MTRNAIPPAGDIVYACAVMILSNGRVILSNEIRDDLDVVVLEGKIRELRPRAKASEMVDVGGNYLAPGFIDLHLHGAAGRDSMEAGPDALGAICDYHARGGTTSLLITTATAELENICSALAIVRKCRSQFPQIAGAHVEGPFLSPEKAGAQDARFICEPTLQAMERLLQYRDIIKRITIAPEIPGVLECIARFCSAGISVSGGHSNAWDEQARAGFERGMRSVTHAFNCMSSARKRGVTRIAGLLEFALSERELNCELIADGHHVSPTLMKMLYRAKGPDRICLVTDATAGAGLPEGSEFELAGKKCVVSQGVCLLADRSALAGSAASMIDLVRNMVRKVGISLPEAIAMASRNPAREVGLTNKGAIAAGNDADLVVISPELEIKQTFVRGECVYSRSSKV